MEHRPPFDCIALLLQGGGALGAYQAGVYEALAKADLHPDWVAGTSIGAINSAIISGNTRERRVGKLREFWELVSQSPFGFDADLGRFPSGGDAARAFAQQTSAITATMLGVPGFYGPRIPSAMFQPPGTLKAMSFYDTTLLKATLERLVDFDLINSESHDVRLSLGSVNVRSGQLVYFDSTTDIIRAEHVMASGALAPWFPAVEIGSEYYWDGGVISNTPLEWLARQRLPDTLAFQVDLWAAPGELPKNVPEVMTRMKEILNSSRTTYRTKGYQEINHLYAALFRFLRQVPEEFKRGEDAEYLMSVARRSVHHLVNLVYRPTSAEGASKDNEFSRRSMEERWLAGYRDTVQALRHPACSSGPPAATRASSSSISQEMAVEAGGKRRLPRLQRASTLTAQVTCRHAPARLAEFRWRARCPWPSSSYEGLRASTLAWLRQSWRALDPHANLLFIRGSLASPLGSPTAPTSQESNESCDEANIRHGVGILLRLALVRVCSVVKRASEGIRRILHGVPAVWPIAGGVWASLCIIASMPVI